MTTTIEWLRDALQDHPEVTLFLTLAAGYLIGRIRIGSFKVGPVVGSLLAGLVVGQFGIVIPGVIGKMFFLLFLFAVGYKVGPQFFRGLGRNALPQIFLTLLFSVSGLLATYTAARVLGFDAGTGAGLFAGSLHASEAAGTGGEAIERLVQDENVRHTLTANIAIAYAVTYMIGIFAAILVLVHIGPWVMRINLRDECQKLEDELGMKKDEVGVVSAYKQFVMRAYKVPENVNNRSVAELENSFSPERVFVERVKTSQGIVDADPNLRLVAGDLIVLSGRPKMLAGSTNPLHPYEIEEPELLDIPAIAVDYVLERKDLRHRTLAEIVETLGGEVATRGVYVRKVLRAGEELPLGSEVVLERGDVLTLIGAKRHIDRVAAQLGSVERASNATDLVSICFALGIGGLIGLPALHLSRISIGLGLPVGVLLAALVLGWLHSVRPSSRKVPDPVVWLLDSLGLAAFVTTIGINAGPSFVNGVRSTGLALLVTGIILCVTPYLLTMLVGRYIFRLHPGILLGICAGSGTSSPGLAALQEKAESRVPVLGYGVSYAINAVLSALWGSVIVALLHPS